MPLAAPAHLLVSFRGDLGASGVSPEHWQIGLRFLVGSAPSDVQKTAGATAAKSFITTAANGFTTSTALTEVRYSMIGADGAQVGATGVEPVTDAVGISSSGTPWQATTVVTLVTDGRGKGTKGRVYLPPQSFLVSPSTGLLADADVTQIVSSAIAFFGQMETAVSGDLVVIGHAGTTGPASANPVTRVRVGHVVDTMRSRRRSLTETYLEGLMPA